MRGRKALEYDTLAIVASSHTHMRAARHRRYPEDVELIRSIVAALDAQPAAMPRGGTLTPRRFLQLGLLLGAHSAQPQQAMLSRRGRTRVRALPHTLSLSHGAGSGSGFEALHDLLEGARDVGALATLRTADLSQNFLHAVECAQDAFETNPIYWLLHESIYCDGTAGTGTAGAKRSSDGVSKGASTAGPSAWAAERVQQALGPEWDYTTRLNVRSHVQITRDACQLRTLLRLASSRQLAMRFMPAAGRRCTRAADR